MFGKLWNTFGVIRVVFRNVSLRVRSGKQTSLIVYWSIQGFQRVKEVNMVNVNVIEGETIFVDGKSGHGFYKQRKPILRSS